MKKLIAYVSIVFLVKKIALACAPTGSILVMPSTNVCAGAQITVSFDNGGAIGCTYDIYLAPANSSTRIVLERSAIGTRSSPRLPENITPGMGYRIVVTEEEAEDEYFSQSFEILSAPQPIIVSSTRSICNGSSTTLSAQGASNYVWLNNAETSDVITVAPSATTTYSLLGYNGICNKMAVFTLSVSASLAVSINPSSITICPGESRTLSAFGGSEYSWSTSETTASIVITPAATQTYSVIGMYDGCSNSASANVVVKPTQSMSIIATKDTFCLDGDSLTLSFTWTNNDTLGRPNVGWNTGSAATSIKVAPAATTRYWVRGFATNGCRIDTAFKLISVVDCSSLSTNDFNTTEIYFYPNPSNSDLFIKCKSKIELVFIYNAIGEIVYFTQSENSNGIEILNLQNMLPGNYFIVAKASNENFFNKKLVIN